MLVDLDNFRDKAVRSPEPRKATTLGETLRSSFETTRKTELTISVGSGLFEEYDKAIQRIAEQTGQRLANPITAPPGEREGLEEAFAARARELGVDVPGPQEIRSKVGKDRAGAREADALLREGESGILQGIARFAGTAGAILTDPPIAGSMILGAGAASGIVRTALVEAGIGAGVEVPVQGVVQSTRREVGEEPSLSEAATNVALAGVGGFVGGAALKGAAVGTRELINRYKASPNAHTPAADQAINVLERQHHIEEANPAPEVPGHLEKFDEAYYDLLDIRRDVRVQAETPNVLLDAQGRSLTDTVDPRALLNAEGRPLFEAAEIPSTRLVGAQGQPLVSRLDRQTAKLETEVTELAAIQKQLAAEDFSQVAHRGQTQDVLARVEKELQVKQQRLQDVRSNRPAEPEPEIIHPGRAEVRPEPEIIVPQRGRDEAILNPAGERVKLAAVADRTEYRLPGNVLKERNPSLYERIRKQDGKIAKAEAELATLRDMAEQRKYVNPEAFAPKIAAKEASIRQLNKARKRLDEEMLPLAKAERSKQVANYGKAAKRVMGEDPTATSFDQVQKAVAKAAAKAVDKPIDTPKRTDSPEGALADEVRTPAEPETEEIDEAALFAYLEEASDRKIVTVDENGNLKETSGKALVEDLKDDEAFLREVNDCVARAIA